MPDPDPVSRTPRRRKPANSPVAKLEATGVLVIAVLVLILTVVRHWHHIPWGAR